jgi:hypothetical protein
MKPVIVFGSLSSTCHGVMFREPKNPDAPWRVPLVVPEDPESYPYRKMDISLGAGIPSYDPLTAQDEGNHCEPGVGQNAGKRACGSDCGGCCLGCLPWKRCGT